MTNFNQSTKERQSPNQASVMHGRDRSRNKKYKVYRGSDQNFRNGEMSQETFRPGSLNASPSKLHSKQLQKHNISDTEEDLFDPNDLKLLPVLATHRNQNKSKQTSVMNIEQDELRK